MADGLWWIHFTISQVELLSILVHIILAHTSDKAYSFQIGTPTSKKLFLFESAIDLLSYYELSANKQNNYLSVSGVYQPNKKDTAYTIPAAVTKFLTQNPHIKTIHICFDNDNAGCKAANALYKQLSPKYEAFIEPPTQGKDYNDQLLYERGLPKTFKTRITKNHDKEDLTKWNVLLPMSARPPLRDATIKNWGSI